jgi:hypothetical protein
MYAHDQTVIARQEISRYRSDALGTIQAWKKEDKAKAKAGKKRRG